MLHALWLPENNNSPGTYHYPTNQTYVLMLSFREK